MLSISTSLKLILSSGKELTLQFFVLMTRRNRPFENCVVNCLPVNKILDWSKLKQIADDILSAFRMKNKSHIGWKT